MNGRNYVYLSHWKGKTWPYELRVEVPSKEEAFVEVEDRDAVVALINEHLKSFDVWLSASVQTFAGFRSGQIKKGTAVK